MIVFTDPSRNRKRIRKIEICQQNWESPLAAVGERGFLIASQVSIKGWAQQSCDAQTPSILKWGLTHDWLLAHNLEALVLPDKSVFVYLGAWTPHGISLTSGGAGRRVAEVSHTAIQTFLRDRPTVKILDTKAHRSFSGNTYCVVTSVCQENWVIFVWCHWERPLEASTWSLLDSPPCPFCLCWF